MTFMQEYNRHPAAWITWGYKLLRTSDRGYSESPQMGRMGDFKEPVHVRSAFRHLLILV